MRQSQGRSPQISSQQDNECQAYSLNSKNQQSNLVYVWFCMNFHEEDFPKIKSFPFESLVEVKHLTLGDFICRDLKQCMGIEQTIRHDSQLAEVQYYITGFDYFGRLDSDVIYMKVQSYSKILKMDFAIYANQYISTIAIKKDQRQYIPHISHSYVQHNRGKEICKQLNKSFKPIRIYAKDLVTKYKAKKVDTPQFSSCKKFLKQIYLDELKVSTKFFKRSESAIKYWKNCWDVQLTGKSYLLNLSEIKFDMEQFVKNDWNMVQYIDFYGCLNFKTQTFEQLRIFLQNAHQFKNLKVLQLGYVNFRNREWQLLAENIHKFSLLSYLTLNGNKIDYITKQSLIKLQKNTSLRTIRLKKNNLKNQSKQIIVKFMEKCKQIRFYPLISLTGQSFYQNPQKKDENKQVNLSNMKGNIFYSLVNNTQI